MFSEHLLNTIFSDHRFSFRLKLSVDKRFGLIPWLIVDRRLRKFTHRQTVRSTPNERPNLANFEDSQFNWLNWCQATVRLARFLSRAQNTLISVDYWGHTVVVNSCSMNSCRRNEVRVLKICESPLVEIRWPIKWSDSLSDLFMTECSEFFLNMCRRCHSRCLLKLIRCGDRWCTRKERGAHKNWRKVAVLKFLQIKYTCAGEMNEICH